MKNLIIRYKTHTDNEIYIFEIGCGFVEEACDNCKTYACNYRPSGNRIVNGIPEPAYEVT